MFSYHQISRWLSFNADPIVVEDWLANREIFGAVEKPNEEDQELEIAYSTEKARNKTLEGGSKDWPVAVFLNGTDISGIVEQGKSLLIVPNGKVKAGKKLALEVELESGGEMKKISMGSWDILAVPVKEDKETKVKVKLREGLTINSKNEISWSGPGISKIVFDTRGRPLQMLDGDNQRTLMKKMLEQLRS